MIAVDFTIRIKSSFAGAVPESLVRDLLDAVEAAAPGDVSELELVAEEPSTDDHVGHVTTFSVSRRQS